MTWAPARAAGCTAKRPTAAEGHDACARRRSGAVGRGLDDDTRRVPAEDAARLRLFAFEGEFAEVERDRVDFDQGLDVARDRLRDRTETKARGRVGIVDQSSHVAPDDPGGNAVSGKIFSWWEMLLPAGRVDGVSAAGRRDVRGMR
ncbi:hypothetical protein FDG2_4019 [Candidatus Protofrankia californiensis]|uniref:Uncharacterized protein n=1 Tax=Candidatus Protofrankia californiensis TaxID=1839754 RepID=A0A1C3P2T0_9ACTN|nr:hypothetical protein FDG2_4019 [Candidatus Protofrankia californiensis]